MTTIDPTTKQRVAGASTTALVHCPYCALDCGLGLEVEDGVVVGMSRWKESPLTGGAVCVKGRNAHQQIHHPDRLTAPLVRQGSDFVEVGWDEALDRAADGFLQISREHGPAANAVLSGGSLTNEKVYLIGKFARLALRTPHVDYNGRFCMAAAGAANTMAFGADRMMTPLSELENAEVVVVVGANISAAFPVVIPKLLDGVRRRGGRVVVVDPRGSRFVKPDDLHVALRPGTDGVFFGGLLREAIFTGLLDGEFIRDRTKGFDDAESSVASLTPDMVAAHCGVSAELVREVTEVVGSTRRCMYLHGRGPEQQTAGVDHVTSIINLGLACGHVGGPGRGINMLTGQRNGQGGREWGQRCDQLPAGRRIDDPGDRAVVAERWGVDPDRLPGAGWSYTEVLDAAGRGEVRGMLVFGTNMSVSAPDLNTVEAQMKQLSHCVVVDPFFSESAKHADVVLPGTTFGEEEGTITTIEGRVVLNDRAVEPLAGHDDIATINALAERLGGSSFFQLDEAREVFEEMRRVSKGGFVDYSGITYERLRSEGGLFWPVPSERHPGTPQLYVEEFAHANGRARFRPIDVADAAPVSHPSYVLTTGRSLGHFLSGNQTFRVPTQGRPSGPTLEVHPDTATQCGLVVNELVRVTSRYGSSEMAWLANPELRADTLFLPYHWPECNRLVSPEVDPVAKIPSFKYTVVTLRSAQLAPQPSEETP